MATVSVPLAPGSYAPEPPPEAVASSILFDIFGETDDGPERDAKVARFVELQGAED